MMAAPAQRTRPVVAIDGPAGAGKSTVAQHLARRFGLLNLETGAMYRAFALKALLTGTPMDDEPALMALSATSTITLEPTATGNRVLLDGTDVTDRIREAAKAADLELTREEWYRLLIAARGEPMP